MPAERPISDQARAAALDAASDFIHDLVTVYRDRELDAEEEEIAASIAETRLAAEDLDRSNQHRKTLIDRSDANLMLLMSAVDQRIEDGAKRAASAALSSFISTVLPIIVRAAAAAAL